MKDGYLAVLELLWVTKFLAPLPSPPMMRVANTIESSSETLVAFGCWFMPSIGLFDRSLRVYVYVVVILHCLCIDTVVILQRPLLALQHSTHFAARYMKRPTHLPR
jgi:hypothetical protein